MSSKSCRTESSGTISTVAVDYSGDVIEIHVEDIKFYVHKKIICRTSAFFENAAKPEWQGEDGPRPVVLDDDTAQAFQLYTVWLYNDSIERADATLKTWEPLSQAYVMGERLMDTTFQSVIFKAMFDRSRIKLPSIETINRIYRGTSSHSPARRLVIDICVWKNCSCLDTIDNPIMELDQDLVRDLLKALMALPKPNTPDASRIFDIDRYLAIDTTGD